MPYRAALHLAPIPAGCSELRLNYTVIGDAVNVASRLEGANKSYGTQILIGGGTQRLAGKDIVTREVDSIAVYGREQGRAVYELVGLLAGEIDAERQRAYWISRCEQGLAKYRKRNFSDAILDFRAVLDDRHHDRPSEVMLDRCKQLQQQGANEEWATDCCLRSK